jgi:thioredoxin reductase (NADPH)
MQAKTGITPKMPEQEAPKPKAEATAVPTAESDFFDAATLAQLNAVFSRMENNLILELSLDDRPVSRELRGYMEALANQTEKLTVRILPEASDAPRVKILRTDGTETGLSFHGVPGGHEFTSFILGLYNAAGPGQPLDGDIRAAIGALAPVNLKVLVSLSCTMCPELVTAAQKIAALNQNITAAVYDLTHFPEIREQYNVMSVPCLVVDDGRIVTFGKKNIRQLVDILK